MISKVISSFLLGLIFVLLLDFLLFIGIKINYIDIYNIKVYYNPLFVDNQPYIVLFVLSIIFGYFISSKKRLKLFAYIYIVLIFLSLSTFYKPIGKNLGELLFKRDSLSFKVGKTAFNGDLLYRGRRYTYIFRKDIDKMIKLPNNDLLYSK